MAIAFVAAGTAATNSTAGTTNSPGIPAGLTNGQDWMYMGVAISGDKTGSLNTPAGWTKLGASANGTSITLVVYRKLFATGEAAPSVTWTASNKNTGRIIGYAGIHTSTPDDVSIVFATGSSNTPTSPTATALTRGAMRAHFVAQAANATSTADWRMVERVDQTTSSTNAAHLAIDEEQGMAEGALGTRADTSSGNAAWVAATLWVKPATAATFGLLQSNQYVSSATGTPHTVAYPNALTAGSFLTAGIAMYHGSGATVSSVSYASGTAWTKTGEPDELGTNLEVVGYHYLNNVNTTAATVSVALSSGQDAAIWIAEWLGPPTTGSVIDQIGTNTASSGTAVSVSTSSATSSGTLLAVMYASPFNVETAINSNTSTYTPRWSSPDATHMAFFAQSREFSGGGTETAAATLVNSSSEWEAAIVVYLPAGAGVDLFPLLPASLFISPLYRL